MNKYASNICVMLFILVLLGIVLSLHGISFHYNKLFYENVLQKTTCTNIDSYQVTIYTSTVKDFPVDSLTYYRIPNYSYDFGVNYTCWWNPFNNLMSLSYFITLDGTVYEHSGYYSSAPIFYSNNIRAWEIKMICLFSILSVLEFAYIISLIFNIIRYCQTVQYADLNVNTTDTPNTDDP